MSTKDNGGDFPAFPVMARDGVGQPYLPTGGMSIRDHFAGLAMQALFGTPFYLSEDEYKGSGEYAKELAQDAYAVADYMLKARES